MISFLLTLCCAASESPNDTGPTLPINIARIRATCEISEVIPVTPADTPTVAKADIASNTASIPEKEFCSSGLVVIRIMEVTLTTTIPKNRMAMER